MMATKFLEQIEAIEFDENMDLEGLLGYTILTEADEDGYVNISKGIRRILDNNPNQGLLIEQVLIAICGWGFDSLIKRMEENKDYYEGLE